jgi:hypothetical protein
VAPRLQVVQAIEHTVKAAKEVNPKAGLLHIGLDTRKQGAVLGMR